jgi:hypothetical protein
LPVFNPARAGRRAEALAPCEAVAFNFNLPHAAAGQAGAFMSGLNKFLAATFLSAAML